VAASGMADFLTTYAQVQPNKVAVIDDRPDSTVLQLTFAELEAESNRLGRVLQELGSGPGTKVVWCGQNSIPLVVAVSACRKIGTTAVPLNYRLSDDEAAYVTDHSDTRIVFVDSEFAPMFARIRDRLPQVEHVLVFDTAAHGGSVPEGMTAVEPLMANASDEPVAAVAAGTASATMIYTSGTTGKPKGALRRTGNDPQQGAALLQMIGYQPDDIYVPTGPLYHSGPLGFLAIGQALGQTVVLQRKFNAEDWLRLVDKYRVTSTFSAPTPIRMICALPTEVKAKYNTGSIKRMIANAAPWSYSLKQQYLADFPSDSLWEVYGSTELGVNCVMKPEDQLRKPGSCGLAAPLVDIKLFDDDGNEVTGFGPEHPGELFVRAASVFSEYYKQPDKFAADRRGEYQTVGDIAYRDDEGFLYICDRKKDMIISGGMNVYPAEIEAALEQHPKILEAAVFGIPSEEWGELVHAVVVARSGETLIEAEVTAHCRDVLANYKLPRSIAFALELPKTGSGKILKRELRAPFWEGRASQV
jgi:acyl-CoA synthetase (AMP-forming)/AMP-acid ligase II